jgi:hypothetical protein
MAYTLNDDVDDGDDDDDDDPVFFNFGTLHTTYSPNDNLNHSFRRMTFFILFLKVGTRGSFPEGKAAGA